MLGRLSALRWLYCESQPDWSSALGRPPLPARSGRL